MKLKYLAKIESGFLFQGRVTASETGAHRVAQITSDPASGRPSFSSYRFDLRWSSDRPKGYQFAKVGDVIFQARGTPLAVLVRETEDNVVIPAHFFIIRGFENSCAGEYLEWILNVGETRQYFKSQAQGSSLQFVSKSVLGNLELVVPPKNVQSEFLNQIQSSNQKQSKIVQLQEAIKKLKALQSEQLEAAHRAILANSIKTSEVKS